MCDCLLGNAQFEGKIILLSFVIVDGGYDYSLEGRELYKSFFETFLLHLPISVFVWGLGEVGNLMDELQELILFIKGSSVVTFPPLTLLAVLLIPIGEVMESFFLREGEYGVVHPLVHVELLLDQRFALARNYGLHVSALAHVWCFLSEACASTYQSTETAITLNQSEAENGRIIKALVRLFLSIHRHFQEFVTFFFFFVL